mgnify:CR=1 FL=1
MNNKFPWWHYADMQKGDLADLEAAMQSFEKRFGCKPTHVTVSVEFPEVIKVEGVTIVRQGNVQPHNFVLDRPK